MKGGRKTIIVKYVFFLIILFWKNCFQINFERLFYKIIKLKQKQTNKPFISLAVCILCPKLCSIRKMNLRSSRLHGIEWVMSWIIEQIPNKSKEMPHKASYNDVQVLTWSSIRNYLFVSVKRKFVLPTWFSTGHQIFKSVLAYCF